MYKNPTLEFCLNYVSKDIDLIGALFVFMQWAAFIYCNIVCVSVRITQIHAVIF